MFGSFDEGENGEHNRADFVEISIIFATQDDFDFRKIPHEIVYNRRTTRLYE